MSDSGASSPMRPSEAIIAAATATQVAVDEQGRRLTLRRMTVLEKLRLFKAAGPVLAQNGPWLGIAVLACSVTAVDDIPVPMPANEQQIESLVARLGDAGVSAVASAVAVTPDPTPESLRQDAGN